MEQEANTGRANTIEDEQNCLPLSDCPLRYLKEEPVTVTVAGEAIDTSEVSFAHENIAEGIVKIIQSVPTPYCIGLSGAWGSGKTGIAKSAANIIKAKGPDSSEKESSRIITQYFDVLEHSEDVFRRQLLIALDNDLLYGNMKFKHSLYQSTTYEETPYEHSFPPVRGIWQWNCGQYLKKICLYAHERLRYSTWKRSLFILFFATGFLLYAWRNLSPTEFWVTIYATVIAALLGLSPQLFKAITILRNDEAPKSPEQLNSKFEELLKNIGCTKKRNENSGGKRLLLILDNLDRCDPGEVAEVLAALTTFVKRPNIISLVPCDVEKIIDAMAQVPEPSLEPNNDSNRSANEKIK